MIKKENPASTGLNDIVYTSNVAEYSSPVKTLASDNLIFFHGILAELPAEEYKAIMSAIVQYATNGTIPTLTGHVKVIFTLAKDRLDEPARRIRTRGGQIGNRNAAKKRAAESKNESETNKNESKTNVADSSRAAHVPAPAPVPVPADTPSHLNLNNNLNLNNLNLLNYLNCENESDAERAKRIQCSLKAHGLFLPDKSVNKVLSVIPDTMWLVTGCDFPSYLADYVVSAYRGKGKTSVELAKLYMSALNPAKWSEPWESYPNWLEQRIGNIIADKEALKRKTYPLPYCPECGESAALHMGKCEKCGGFYEWNESANAHTFVKRERLDFSGAMDKIVSHSREKLARVNHA